MVTDDASYASIDSDDYIQYSLASILKKIFFNRKRNSKMDRVLGQIFRVTKKFVSCSILIQKITKHN